MPILLRTRDGLSLEYDPKLGGFKHAGTVPCLQCGTCCSRWQAQVNAREIAAIAETMGVPLAEFYGQYIREYPVRPDTYLIRHKDGACVFLRREGGRALCAIHSFKPEVCRAWKPSLARKECRDGLRRLGQGLQFLTPDNLNLSLEEMAAFCQSLRDYSIMEQIGSRYEQKETCSSP
ncbi:MAG: YkgJ family cysteine cluster protein [Chloroflexota bacterium]